MPTFVTKVRTESGTTEERLVTVPREDQLGEYLSRIEGFVLECSPFEGADPVPRVVARAPQKRLSRRRVSSRELVVFSWYLYTLVDAGVPLLKSLQIVAGQLENEVWRRIIAEIVEHLQKGEGFAETLQNFPRCFPKHYVHLIEVGELSGQLDEVLEQLALHGEKQLETRARIRSALAYPTFLLVSCGAVVCFLMAFVVPRVAKMFARAEVQLPWITEAMLAVSDFLRHQYAILGATTIILIAGLAVARRSDQGLRIQSWSLLHMPCLGGIYRKFILANYCRTLALLNRSGVPLLVSLEIARNGLSNLLLKDFFAEVEENLQEGEALGEELARSPYVPELVSSMISVGEETGRLTEMLTNVTRFYERDIDHTIQLLPKIVEPLVIVGMTGVVGLIAASVFIPLASLTQGLG